MEPNTIGTDRLLLEPWHESDSERWVSLTTDERVWSRLGAGDPLDRDFAEKECEWMVEHWREHGFGWRSMIERSSDRWMGAVGLAFIGENPVGLPADDVEIGWWLLPDFWGRAFATEGAKATRDEGFEKSFVDHFWARHNARNPASGRIMEKIGMTFERDGTGIKDVPVRIYSMTRERWSELKKVDPGA
jgi:RimJ/RimL family protein N-acetyltransferase